MSFARASRPGQGAREQRRAAPRAGREADLAAVLQLQRALGNRGTRALLRAPVGAPPEFTPLQSGAFAKAGLDAKSWKEKVIAAKQAIREHDSDLAAKLYVELYQDLARTAGAEALADVTDKYPINIAKGDDTGYKPGLNLVLGSGGSLGGTTAFVDAAGKFGVGLSLSTAAAQQHIAIRLFGGSFNEDKALTLGTLRHEMTHVRHLERALASVGRWMKAGGKGGAAKLEEWLKTNRKGLSDADVVLTTEAAGGRASNSEVLAYVEGFTNTFHLIDPPPPVDHPVFLELLGVLETTRLLPWRSADKSVRDLAVQRLERYYCETLDPDRRRAFDAWVQAQTKRAQDDEAALKANTDRAAVAGARGRQQNAFADFVKALAPISGKCSTTKTPVKRSLQRQPTKSRPTFEDAPIGQDDLEIKAGGLEFTTEHVEGGAVTVTLAADADWSEPAPRGGRIHAPLKRAVAFRFTGAAAARAHWIQFIWREIIIADANGRKTWLTDRTKNSAGVEYSLTPKGGPPQVAVDRATLSEPWYEHKSPSHRDATSITVADVPSAHEDLVRKGLDSAAQPSSGASIAHLVTYLVREDKVLFRVATDATYVWTPNKSPRGYSVVGPTYATNGGAAQKLDPAHRAALVRDFPDMDYLP